MTGYILVKYLHYLGILAVFSSLVGEHLLLEDRLSRKAIQRLSIVDAVYGIGALLVMGAGFTLWFGVGKPAEFYSNGWIIYAKLILFGVVGAISLIPTFYFLKERKGHPEELVDIPRKMKMILRIELTLVLIIPLLGAMMAMGVGAG
jgi:putative membrane protein